MGDNDGQAIISNVLRHGHLLHGFYTYQQSSSVYDHHKLRKMKIFIPRGGTVGILALIFLTILPVLIGFYLHASKTNKSRSHQELFLSLVQTDLASSFRHVSRSFYNPSSFEEREVSSQGLVLPEIILASHFPVEQGRTSLNFPQCKIHNYGDKPVGLDCVSLVTSSGSPHLSTQMVNEAKRVAGQLRNVYDKQLAKLSPRRRRTNSPTVLFVYAVVQKENFPEYALFYPATHFDISYTIQDRPWYKAIRKAREGKIEATHIYRDYVTNKQIMSVVFAEYNPPKNQKRKIALVADLDVTGTLSGIEIYLLNTVIAFVASITYWWVFTVRKLRFQMYLTYSMLCVFIAYLTLTINSLFQHLFDEALPNAFLLEFVLPYLPAGALVIAAGNALFASNDRLLVNRLIVWYIVEFTAASLSVATGQRLFSTMFSCCALSLFGWLLIRKGKDYTQISRLPATTYKWLPVYAGVSYIVWGIVQFSLLLGEFDNPLVRRVFSLATSYSAAAEILLTDSAIFTYLLYAKAPCVSIVVAPSE